MPQLVPPPPDQCPCGRLAGTCDCTCDQCSELRDRYSAPLVTPRCDWCGSRSCQDMVCRNCTRCHAYPCTCVRCSYCGSRWCQNEQCQDCSYCGERECVCVECEGCGNVEHQCTCNEMPEEIQSYSYRPTPIFHGTGPLFMGMELEIETRRMRESYNVVESTLGDLVYCKEDGSLSNGFEIVTHPMSYEYAMTEVPWTSALRSLRDSGAFTGSDTGIHVHVNRSAFAGPSHVYRWMKFWYRNAPQIRRFARRSSHWGDFHRDGRRAIKAIATKGHVSWEDGLSVGRYNAINSQPTQTFEVRVFASSLKTREVKGALSFTASTVEFARTLTAQDVLKKDGWSWSSYVDFLNQRTEYAPALQEVSRLCVS